MKFDYTMAEIREMKQGAHKCREIDNRHLKRLGAPYRYDAAGIRVCAECGCDWTEEHHGAHYYGTSVECGGDSEFGSFS